MSGQKQKRPYKRKPILIGDEVSDSVPSGPFDTDQIKEASDKLLGFRNDDEPAPTEKDIVTALRAGELGVIPQTVVTIHSCKGKSEIGAGLSITAETVSRVEAAIGRTSNAWGMVDPLELIRAVDRVLRGVRNDR